MTETKATRQVRRGRIFPEIQWSPEKKAQWQAERETRRKQCEEIFNRLQPNFLKTHYNWFMAIDPETGDYVLDRNEEVAALSLRKKHPNRIPVLYKINETGVCGTI